MTTFAPVPAPVLLNTQVQTAPAIEPKKQKQLTCDQIVFTILESMFLAYKKAGQKIDHKATKQVYKNHYAGWSQARLTQAALALVKIYDRNTKQWRLIRNENELRYMQQYFSRAYLARKKRFANINAA